MSWDISSTHGCFCRACVRQDLDSFCPYLQRKANFPRRQARAVAPVVPRRSVRDCYREPDQPASREARRRAAVKPRPACFPSSTLRGCAAQSGVKGGERKRVPSGHNRRRRLATGSRQPKRGFGTAVPKTTIEVADHYPLLSRRWPARWCCSRRKPSDRSRRPLPYRSLC